MLAKADKLSMIVQKEEHDMPALAAYTRVYKAELASGLEQTEYDVVARMRALLTDGDGSLLDESVQVIYNEKGEIYRDDGQLVSSREDGETVREEMRFASWIEDPKRPSLYVAKFSPVYHRIAEGTKLKQLKVVGKNDKIVPSKRYGDMSPGQRFIFLTEVQDTLSLLEEQRRIT